VRESFRNLTWTICHIANYLFIVFQFKVYELFFGGRGGGVACPHVTAIMYVLCEVFEKPCIECWDPHSLPLMNMVNLDTWIREKDYQARWVDEACMSQLLRLIWINLRTQNGVLHLGCTSMYVCLRWGHTPMLGLGRRREDLIYSSWSWSISTRIQQHIP